jgi:hypothetical protein
MITIALHVDDLLVTSKETRLLEWERDKLKAKYGNVLNKTDQRIKYLGIMFLLTMMVVLTWTVKMFSQNSFWKNRFNLAKKV